MNKDKILFKMWFINGTYIEKESVLDESRAVEVLENLKQIKYSVQTAFDKKLNGNLYIDGLIIRLSELIAIDIIPITEQ